MTTNRKIKQLFLNQPIQLVWDRTQGITDKGQLYVGGRAGLSADIVNLCHEMAHFVEIDDERCDAPDWGFHFPEVWIYDRMCIEPTTHQMTDRECRVAALQQSLLAYVGRPLSARTLVRAFHYLPDYYMVPGKDQKTRLKWCAARVKELSVLPEYGLDYFMHEWARKNTILLTRGTRGIL